MRRFATLLLGLAALLMVAGCNADKVAGYYYSQSGDGLLIKPNGEVYWSPVGKTKDDPVFLCVLDYDRKAHGASLIFPSASTYLYTTVKFSDDLQVIHVDWRRVGGKPVEHRGTEYRREPKK